MSAQHRERELRHFLLLDPDEQRAAILRMASSGVAHSTIAAAAGIAVEQVRAILGERGQCEGCAILPRPAVCICAPTSKAAA
jgi:hypothetical protein